MLRTNCWGGDDGLLWKFGKVEERWHNSAHAAQMARGENTDHAAAGIDLGPIKDGWKID